MNKLLVKIFSVDESVNVENFLSQAMNKIRIEQNSDCRIGMRFEDYGSSLVFSVLDKRLDTIIECTADLTVISAVSDELEVEQAKYFLAEIFATTQKLLTIWG